MKFFDKDFLKFTFQFLAIVAVGVFLISFVSGLDSRSEVTAGVIDGR
ncbi:MAG: hypothetical protein Q7S19_02755 [bacterium]|nr:hypothetical protein [bacterium]